jgi:phenylacetate-CoA ligase
MKTNTFKPDWYSHIVKRVVAPLWAMKEGSPYLRHLDMLQGADRIPYFQVRERQHRKLGLLLRHAVEHTDYYRTRIADAGILADDIHCLDDVVKLPILSKDDIRAYRKTMIADNIPREKLFEKKTSGSTGVSVELCVDDESAQWKRACAQKYDRWAGWDLGYKIGAIWGNPQHDLNWKTKVRNLLLERYVFLDTLKMDEAAMRRYYEELMVRRPPILFGHAHSLFLFARYLETHELFDVRPIGIISTCMVLHDFERKTIEKVFGCRVTNRYGCEEVSLIACECPEGNMHLNCDTLIIEFIRDGKPVKPGEPGAIVVTDLTNYGMPFIRYKVGDVGVPSAKTSCPCGCTYPILESLEGRVADYVVTPGGDYISGISLTENFAMHLPGVKQMQIVQERIDFLQFRIVKGESFSAQTVVDIKRLATERFGNQMSHEIQFVDSIQSESSGKYRFCISKIQNPFS